ncbi:MAG: DUF72 domain-containing protein [Streptosporangiales bacterium]|nr:DUF72 domain-containing protein [Streptosporangiales bacterium]
MAAQGADGTVKVGTASWTDKTLLASGWYPSDATTPEARLKYYAEQFPLVEVDSTYYSPPNENVARSWVERTPPGFTFNVKAFSLLTQHPTKPRALYKDLRPETTKNVYLKDLDDDVVEQVWERFLGALQPLHEAGKLGALLFQFPQWFVIGKRNREYILRCRERADPMPICVEFRNKTWLSEENERETLDFLEKYALPYVCVDMPQGHTSSVRPVVAATADLAVIRFHGHSDNWTSRDIYERFGYLYSGDEVAAWAPRVRELAGQAREVHSLWNNCYSDYAQRNARQVIDALTEYD